VHASVLTGLAVRQLDQQDGEHDELDGDFLAGATAHEQRFGTETHFLDDPGAGEPLAGEEGLQNVVAALEKDGGEGADGGVDEGPEG